jgi:hypothetical protein
VITSCLILCLINIWRECRVEDGVGQLKIGMELGRFMGVKGGTIRNGREGVKRERWVYYSIIYVMFCSVASS